jgi:hypothetical protein
MKTPRSPWLALALVVILLAGAAVDDALAKKPKSRLSAFVNSKKLKASKRGLTGVYATTSFSIGGASKPKRRLVRSVTATCGAVDIKTATLPVTLSCFGSYTEAGKSSAFRQWTGLDMTVIVDSRDGNRIGGSFAGVLTDPSSANPTDASATVEGGSFSMVLIDIGV